MRSKYHRRNNVIACIAGMAISSTPLVVAGSDSVPGASGPIDIETNSLGPSTRIAGASSVWIRYTPTLSVDCSPPRGCYAATQRILYNFSCKPRYAVLMERISMDLNGAIIKHEVSDTYGPADDPAAIRVLNKFCSLRD